MVLPGIGLPADRYANHSLLGGTFDWDCFRPVTARNRPVTVDFDCRCPLKGSFSQAAVREKEEEGEEKGELGDPAPLSLDALNPSSPSLVGRCRRGEHAASSSPRRLRCLSGTPIPYRTEQSSLQELAAQLTDLWNLMDTPMEEQSLFSHVTSNMSAMVDEVTVPGALALDLIEQTY
ncbi:hypothetical protein B296_00050286 [Ensete ventricosum]|uniref:Uncharacterized protein n=1 Tax=Ensete ventricosum TaxID=4639 RepID=A0A426XEL9_ENSVE|nr:hypothetical protein B296_00050286 [Ensete ventricosum]